MPSRNRGSDGAVEPDIPGPHPSPREPRFRLPAGSCDAHCHIFGPVARFPFVTPRPYTPPEAPPDMLRALHARLGIDRAVLVNATPYGSDNAIILAAIAASRGAWRGVATVREDVADHELRELARGGVDGCRFTFLGRLGRRPDADALRRMADRVAPIGWHLDLYVDGPTLVSLAPDLRRLPVPYVIDHMALADASLGVEQAGFHQLCELLGTDDRCWVKLSCAERVSRIGAPFADAVPLAFTLAELAPDRVLWGTDWPHPNVPVMPDDGDLVDWIPLVARDEAAQRRLLVDNPARLFQFNRSPGPASE